MDVLPGVLLFRVSYKQTNKQTNKQHLSIQAQEKMEDAKKESVAGGVTSACEAQPADSRSMPTNDTLRNMQAAAPQYNAGGQMGSGC